MANFFDHLRTELPDIFIAAYYNIKFTSDLS